MTHRMVAIAPFAIALLWSILLMGAAQPRGSTPPADDRLTPENYAKIQNGMTPEQVKEILGPNKSSQSSGGSPDVTLGWRRKNDAAHKIEVHFKNGVVVSKSSTIPWEKEAAKAQQEAAKAQAANLKSNFEKLKPGMSPQEVEAIMGAPTKADRASAGRSGLTWLADQKFAYVIFQDDKATEMDCSETPPKNKDITPANYARIHEGMALAEVESILGPAAEQGEQPGGKRYTWKQGNKTLAVVIRDATGKVGVKTSSLRNAPLVSFEKTADDKFETAVANLSSGDAHKQRSALAYLADAPFDAARAPEVSRQIEKCLSSKDTFVAQAAQPAIRKWATKENVPHFLRIITRPITKSPNDKNRDQIPLALQVLGKLKEPSAVAPIVKLLGDFFSRDEAADAVRLMGPELTEKELQKHLGDTKNGVMMRAVTEILEEFKDGGGARMERCLRDLRNTGGPRAVSAQTIGKMYVHPKRRAEVAKALEPLLADSDQTVVWSAAGALVRWGGPENEEALIKALSHPWPDARVLVLHALREHGTARALSALEAQAQEKNHQVAVAATEAIAAIKGR